jgi:hypothetical protein
MSGTDTNLPQIKEELFEIKLEEPIDYMKLIEAHRHLQMTQMTLIDAKIV